MSWLKTFRLRFAGLLRKQQLDSEMETEMRSHIELQTQENLEAGMNLKEARLAALRQFGWIESIKETCRDQRGMSWVENLSRDTRYGARMLRKNPSFTIAAVMTLAVGIGANTAIFSVVNAVLLQPLPFKNPDRLVTLWEGNPGQGYQDNMPSGADYLAWKSEAKSFEQMAIFNPNLSFALTGLATPLRIQGTAISANLFDLLGIKPEVGRPFTQQEEIAGHDDVAVISDRLKTRLLGRELNPLGQSLILDGRKRIVIGVMPPNFHFPGGTGIIQHTLVNEPSDVWIPLTYSADFWQNHSVHFLQAIGRLRHNATIQHAQAELTLIQARLAREFVGDFLGTEAKVVPLREQGVSNVRRGILVLAGAVGCLLLITCVNIANLLLARASARQREFAVRMALGAGPAAIFRQFLAESLLLCLVGAGFGCLLAIWGTQAFKSLLGGNFAASTPGWQAVSLCIPVLCFTIAISIVCALFFTVVPARLVTSSLLGNATNLGERSASSGRASQKLRGSFVVAQISFAMILLTGAALMIQSFVRLVRAPLGFETQHILALAVTLPELRYPNDARRLAFFDELVGRIRALPGVQSAAMGLMAPFGGAGKNYELTIEGLPPDPHGKFLNADLRPMTEDFFGTLGIPLVRGRMFDGHDNEKSAAVALVNETFVRRYLGNENPIGRRLKIGGLPNTEIIGVIRDFKQQGIDRPLNPQVYAPLSQMPFFNVGTIVIRVQGDPMSLARSVRAELAHVDKDQPIDRLETMQTIVSGTIAQPRFQARLLGLFGVLAVALAGGGLYGVLAYLVKQRTHEIGIRLALGARRRHVLWLVLGRGLRFAIAGLCLGLLASAGLTRVMASLLYDVKAADPITFAAVSFLFIFIALLASWVPARRATRIDPMNALRYE
jgi:putative ABC transport system permease protein